MTINLLPQQTKEQVQFAKHNRVVLGYLFLVVVVLGICGGLFGWAWLNLDRREQDFQKQLVQRQNDIAGFKGVEDEAKSANARLSAIKTIQGSQSRFSLLLADLGKYTPKGVFISNINLTGDDKKPVRITADADTYANGVALRDAMASNPRISAADLETINFNGDAKVYSVSVTIAFKPGQAR
jgi:Tfp pilus assembly protein PilN